MLEIRTIANPSRTPIASAKPTSIPKPTSTPKPLTEAKHCVPGATVITLDAGNKVFRTVTYNEIRTEVMRFAGVTKTGAYAMALAEIYERGVNDPLEKTA